MNESLYTKYVNKFFPKLQKLVETVNKKRNTKLTYLHKGAGSMLRTDYSPDNKWESTSVDTTYVAADFVSMDSELPLKSRDTIATANGKIPKIGMSKALKESDINMLNVMEAQGGNTAKIAKKLANDAISCSVGIDEQNEFNFLYGLSHGYVGIEDEDQPDKLMRLNFGYFPSHTFGAETKGEISLEDIKRVIKKADDDGNTIIKICLAKSAYDKLRQTREAKELVMNYEGHMFTPESTLPTPTASKFNEAFSDDNNGIVFQIIDRSVIREKNGVKTSVKPWAASRLVFLCNEIVGTLVYGRLAEEGHPVAGVKYQKLDAYKLISKYSETNPLREMTAGQAIVAPIIEDVDQIYVYDFDEAQEVNTEAESLDSSDLKITVWGQAYTKATFVTALNKIAHTKLSAKTTDDKVIAAVNKLSDEEEAELKTAVESAKAE